MLWKPLDLSAEEQFIAMMNKQLQSSQNIKNNNKNKNNKQKMKQPNFPSQQGYGKEWDKKIGMTAHLATKNSHSFF